MIDDTLEKVKTKVIRAMFWHGGFSSAHEMYAVLMEEVDELWDIVRQKKESRNMADLEKELIQIAAMAVKGIEYIDNFTK